MGHRNQTVNQVNYYQRLFRSDPDFTEEIKAIG